MLIRAGRLDEAIARGREAVAAAAALTPPHPISAYAHAMLGEALLQSGQAAEALPLLQRALAQREQLLPAEHPVRLNSLSLVGAAQAAAGDRVAGLERMRQAAERLQATLGATHEFTQRAHARIARYAPDAARADAATPQPLRR